MSQKMQELLKLLPVYKLKEIERRNRVHLSTGGKRFESSAEHSWSMMVLADFLLLTFEIDVDRLKVYELISYHDLVESYSGDFPLDPSVSGGEVSRDELERQAFEKLCLDLPLVLVEKYRLLHMEYLLQKTVESRFVKIVDVLDPIVQALDHKDDWKGWSVEFLRSKKRCYFEYFPKILGLFDDLLVYVEEEEYFPFE